MSAEYLAICSTWEKRNQSPGGKERELDLGLDQKNQANVATLWLDFPAHVVAKICDFLGKQAALKFQVNANKQAKIRAHS